MIEIYYADDDTDDLSVFAETVNKLVETNEAEIALRVFTGGEALLNAIRKRRPTNAVIFLDVNMPGKNGFQVLAEIRKEKQFEALPVIMYSTSSDQDTIKTSREKGATLYAVKPNYIAAMSNLIKKVVHIDWSSFTANEEGFVLNMIS